MLCHGCIVDVNRCGVITFADFQRLFARDKNQVQRWTDEVYLVTHHVIVCFCNVIVLFACDMLAATAGVVSAVGSKW